MDEKAMQQLEREILVVDISSDGPLAKSEQAINEQLAQIDQQLQFYTSTASTFDYALATAAGILAGAMNALVQKVVESETARKLSTKMNEVPTGADLLRRILPSGIDVDKLPIQDVISKAYPILEQQMTSASPNGFAAAVALALLKATSNTKKDSNVPTLLNLRIPELIQLVPYASVTGLMTWMENVSLEDDDEGWFPEALRSLTSIFNEYPAAQKTAKCARSWFNDLAKQKQSTKKQATNTNLSEAFLVLFERLGKEVPELEIHKLDFALLLAAVKSDKIPFMDDARKLSKKIGAPSLDKQAMPVLLMEALVRTCYLIKGLGEVLRSQTPLDSTTIQSIVPFGNRSVERMITVASMSLVLTNTAEAAICAAIESAGNGVSYSSKFVTRYNYVAAGRCAIAIVREVQMEQKEVELLRKRRELTEEQVKLVTARIEAYKTALAERLDAYLTHDLEVFLAGFEQMDEGLIKGDANMVIAGNVAIQNALGYDPQFQTQDEFEALMESDEDFIL